MTPIREPEVALHVAGKLGRTRSVQVLEASRTDEQVRGWLAKYTQLWANHHRPEQNQSHTAPVELGRVSDRELARLIYRSVEEDDAPVYPSRKDSNRRSVFTVEWALAGDSSVTTGPVLTPPPDLPLRQVNQTNKVLELLEAPEVVPYGVARVTVEVDGKDTFTGLVPFAAAVEGGRPVRKAELWLSEVGIPIGKSSRVEAFVVPADDENLAQFPLAEVEALRKQYAGNLDALDAIDLLVAQKKREGQK